MTLSRDALSEYVQTSELRLTGIRGIRARLLSARRGLRPWSEAPRACASYLSGVLHEHRGRGCSRWLIPGIVPSPLATFSQGSARKARGESGVMELGKTGVLGWKVKLLY